MALYDVEAKKRLGYTDPKSKVRLDGSEVLHGYDWEFRKAELWERAGTQCEELIDGPLYIIGERCRSEGQHAHHLIKRSKGRDDRLKNLILLCAPHHRARHPEFVVRWTKKPEAA